MVFLLAVLGFTVGCSSGSHSGNINGNWTATLNNTDTSPAFNFTTTFSEASSGELTVSNFTFSSNSPCFDGIATTQTGSFGLAGDFNGNVTGTFGMTITTQIANTTTQNTLQLNGAVAGSTITGTWTLSGSSACSGKGTFTLNRS
jgi:hypothetical protein